MDRRVVFSIVGASVIATLVWLTTRMAQSGPALTSPAQTPVKSMTPAAPRDAAEPLVAAGHASADAPKSRLESAVATPDEIDPPTRTAGEPLPIDVSPGFEFLGKSPAEMKDTDPMWSPWRRHQQLEGEPRDDAWAPRIEVALRRGIEDALTARGLDTQRIELPVVECRTNGCEIQAVGYTMDNMKPGVDFQSILPALLKGSLGREFDLGGFSLLVSPRADGRLTFLAMMPRMKN